jgi:hypothetical protein
MTKHRQIFFWSLIIGALLLASCGGSEDTPTVPVEEQTAPPAATIAPTPTEEPSGFFQETPTAQESLGECGPPATETTLGTPVSGETVNDDQPPASREYFCVMIPDGLASLTFELSGMTADLNLYIGYPDLETVQEGGFDFWFTQERGTENKVVVVDRGSSRLVKPGAYYIEVSAEDFSASSPFTLSVSTP